MVHRILWFSICSILCCCCRTTAESPLDIFHTQDPDENRNVSELITSKGYPLEEHVVQTADGYLLSVQRIPYGKTGGWSRNQNGAVLLIHGVLGDASNWVLNFPGQSLGFVLSDAGYDVWLVNIRGCTYSKRNVKYTTDQLQFWNFSFNEVGLYDIPATIDYILDATGENDLYVIGHSQGTTVTFVMLSELPYYNSKVKLFIALAPVANVGYTTSAYVLLLPFADEITIAVNLLKAGEFLPNDKVSRFFRKKICGMYDPEVCDFVLFAVGGLDKAQLNQTRLGVYAANFPSGTSIKTFLHYAQLYLSKEFRKYDYGDRNMEYYHQEEPPDYDLPAITTPVALFSSTNDKIADPQDVDISRRKLNSLVFDYRTPQPYGHFDFILALNAFEVIHRPILKLLSEY